MSDLNALTYAQLEALWISNGGSKATAPVAAAIAEAESSGLIGSTSSNPDGGTNVGLWQLDTKGVGAGYSVAQLSDPDTNAAVAVKGSGNGTDWSDWETYADGSYKVFLSNSTPPDASGLPTGTAASSGTAAGGGTLAQTCLLLVGGGSVIGVGVPQVCLLDKSEARALIGGLCMVAGGLLVLPGLIILVAAGFKGSGAAGALGSAAGPLSRVPVYGRAVSRVT